MNTITATQDEVRELLDTWRVEFWRRVDPFPLPVGCLDHKIFRSRFHEDMWTDGHLWLRGCPYGKPGDVLGVKLARFRPTITSVEVRERDGKWWWVVAVDARNSQESSETSARKKVEADDE
jgi:hypothetical protein